MANSFTFNNIDFATYGLTVESTEGLFGLPEPRIDRKELADYDGEITQGKTWKAREIVLHYVVDADGVWTTNTQYSAAINILLYTSQNSGLKEFMFDNHGLLFLVRLMTRTDPEMFHSGQRGTITLLAPQPWGLGNGITGNANITG